MKATVIGLGSIGWGAAVSLVRGGIVTTGYDVVEDTLHRFEAAGGQSAHSPAEAAAQADVVFVFVVNAQQAQSVLFGTRGAVSAAPLGTVFVLCTTVAPAEAQRLAADLTAAGMGVLDAPVSGGAATAESGDLMMIASGADKAFQTAGPALDAVASKVHRLGGQPGTGSKMKMINQLLAGVHIAAMGEAMVLAQREGLDLDQVYDVIKTGTGVSWMFESRGRQVISGDYMPTSGVDVLVKDLGIVDQTAADLDLPLAQAALSLFTETSEAGLGAEADAAVAKTIAKKAGVVLP
ncbi:MAG: L-threonate dehydrogenase [Pseudomonadota bacterium]